MPILRGYLAATAGMWSGYWENWEDLCCRENDGRGAQHSKLTLELEEIKSTSTRSRSKLWRFLRIQLILRNVSQSSSEIVMVHNCHNMRGCGHEGRLPESQQFLKTWKANQEMMNLGPKLIDTIISFMGSKLVWANKERNDLSRRSDRFDDGENVLVQIALENLLSHHRGSSVHKVACVQLARFTAPREMTWSNNTVADVVNDPVNPNNGGQPLPPFLFFCPS